MEKNAQISQVFTYLATIIVVGVIVLAGYKGISWILKTNCEQGKVSFQKTLMGLIDEYSGRGSTHLEILSVPCEVTAVCFADSRICDRTEETYFDLSSLPDDGVIRSSVVDCDANIFTRGKITEPIGYAPKLVLNESDYPFKCFEAKSGKIKFLLRGTGRKTQLQVEG